MTLFSISSQRRFALFLLVLVALAFVSVAMGISDMDSGSFASSLVVCLLLVWLLLRRDIRYMRTPSGILWSQWDACAGSDEQQARILRASSGELVIKEIDKKARYAVFVSDKKCRTTLSRCSCRDFKRRGVPCEHMYRLAGELGLIELPNLS
jgi:hypothetical protein